MRPTWGQTGADRTQVGPIWPNWTLLSGKPSFRLQSGWCLLHYPHKAMANSYKNLYCIWNKKRENETLKLVWLSMHLDDRGVKLFINPMINTNVYHYSWVVLMFFVHCLDYQPFWCRAQNIQWAMAAEALAPYVLCHKTIIWYWRGIEEERVLRFVNSVRKHETGSVISCFLKTIQYVI